MFSLVYTLYKWNENEIFGNGIFENENAFSRYFVSNLSLAERWIEELFDETLGN